MSLAAVPAFLIARRVVRLPFALLAAVARGGRALDGVHGDRDDREPLLPRRARGRLAAAALPGAARLATPAGAARRASASRSRPARSLSPSFRRSRRRRSCSALSAAGAARCARSSLSTRCSAQRAVLVVAVQAARGQSPATCSARTASSARAATTSARCCASGSGISRSSTCTSGSSRVAALLAAPCALGRGLPPRLCRSTSPPRPRSVRVEQPRGGHVRLAVRLRPNPGPLPLLSRAAPARGAARLGRGWCAAAESRDSGCGARGARLCRCSFRTRVSSASRPSRTRSGCCRCGRSTSTSCSASTGSTVAARRASRSAALFLLVPRRFAVAVPLAVLVLFAVVSKPVWSGPRGLPAVGRRRALPGHPRRRAGLDRRRRSGGRGGRGALDRPRRPLHDQPERVLQPSRRPASTTSDAADTRAASARCASSRGRGRRFTRPGRRLVEARYALLDGSVTPDGVVVARDDQLGTALWRLTGPLSSRSTVTGFYADGNWSGPESHVAAAALPPRDAHGPCSIRSDSVHRAADGDRTDRRSRRRRSLRAG